MNKNNYVWDRDLPKISGYYLATWGQPSIVSKLYYATDFGWTFGKRLGEGSKKIDDVIAWTYLPEPCTK